MRKLWVVLLLHGYNWATAQPAVYRDAVPASYSYRQHTPSVKPSLLPLPRKLVWKEGVFPLYACASIIITQKELAKEARVLQSQMAEAGWKMDIKNKVPRREPVIRLQLRDDISAGSEEAYHLQVSPRDILITARGAHGIFNALQTLRQIVRAGNTADACDIQDQPAFAWRGYMVDVGRNYMSMELLKQQIRTMAYYKLNVFHFHATEDIAWRLEIKKYPQLTQPGTMLRNKGLYYSEAEIRELISYCRERYITFVPELDMPGHSAAFTRAMGTDMQSDSGLAYIKNILTEVCRTYDVPYIHIGADEVKIINKDFVPAVAAHIEKMGKQVIGWQPGGNFPEQTIRQLWMDDRSHMASAGKARFVDSRHLYINHMDPLESVVTIYNRRIGDREQGDSSMLGATLCLWHDRNVAREEDLLQMNPVYPAMLAFAERSWQGGGREGWIANISQGDVAGFTEFENRLMEQRRLFFQHLPFPYRQQAGIRWKLSGPYPNEGDMYKAFPPEKDPAGIQDTTAGITAIGGTIILRHWWAPKISGALSNPQQNTTWYARTTFWSEQDTVRGFWIGFYNLSRSTASDSPPANAWDKKGSNVWINGERITPPEWKRAGRPGNLEIPLTDEGYEYRKPTMIRLHAGWNTVLIKAPVGSFQGRDWQNPVKWMFTFLPSPESNNFPE